MPAGEVRRAGEDDAGAIADLLALAFYDDPTWSWAFPDPALRLEHHRAFWSLYLNSAIPRGWVWVRDDRGAASVWTPPGEPELTEEDEAQVEPLVREAVGPHAEDVLTLMEGFEANRPQGRDHYYLSLLGTHPDHRGAGKGMALLADNLARIDADAMPAYLESSNRANDRRYERLGFELIGEFSAPGGEPTVGCMWREPGGPAAGLSRPGRA
jgi:GNAT superfamily N-acetyltransferase